MLINKIPRTAVGGRCIAPIADSSALGGDSGVPLNFLISIIGPIAHQLQLPNNIPPSEAKGLPAAPVIPHAAAPDVILSAAKDLPAVLNCLSYNSPQLFLELLVPVVILSVAKDLSRWAERCERSEA